MCRCVGCLGLWRQPDEQLIDPLDELWRYSRADETPLEDAAPWKTE